MKLYVARRVTERVRLQLIPDSLVVDVVVQLESFTIVRTKIVAVSVS
jgi:hypothetical protein